MTRYQRSVEQRMAGAAYTAIGWLIAPFEWLQYQCNEWEYRAVQRQRQRRRRNDARTEET